MQNPNRANTDKTLRGLNAIQDPLKKRKRIVSVRDGSLKTLNIYILCTSCKRNAELKRTEQIEKEM